jgi:hypothetical protein
VLDSPVSLVASAGDAGGRAEYFADATDDNSRAIEWTMPAGRYVDTAPGPGDHHRVLADVPRFC